jgi:sugar phosphate permease
MNKQTVQKVSVFFLTFFAYAALHSLREGWSLAKSIIIGIPELNTDKTFLGIVDTCYLISYSLGMMVLGSLIHKISLKIYVSNILSI